MRLLKILLAALLLLTTANWAFIYLAPEAATRLILDAKGGLIGDDELIRLMVENPDLIQRPIVVRGDRAALGRPVQNVEKLLG